MERTILIVDDNDGVAALLKEIVTDLGAAPLHVRGGSEAISIFGTRLQAGQLLPDAVILDLVLSELDGFQVATHLRGLAGGAEVPLIVVSGVYKKLPEAFDAAVHPLFFPKPFDSNTLRQKLQEALDVADRAVGIERGRFLKSTPAALFARLCEGRATGFLEVSTADAKRRLWWQAGQIRFGQSNVRAETAGAMQVQRGELTAAAFDRAVAHARQTKVPLYEAFAATRIFSPEKLSDALKAQTQEVALGVLTMAGGDWMFSQGDPEKMPDARRHPLLMIVENARRTLSPEDARETLLHMGEAKLSRSALLDHELFLVRSAVPGETVTTLLSSPIALVEAVAKTRTDDLPFLWALVTSGLVKIERPEPTPSSSSVRPIPVVEEIESGSMTPASRQARQFILSERNRIAQLDHYELLGVTRTATVEEVKEAFLRLARTYHADAYSDVELGSAELVLSSLFQKLNDAQETLTDPVRRADYDLLLARKAQGLPTDVATVLRAEELFKRAEVIVKSNARTKANLALEILEEAISLNDADPEFHVYRAYAAFRTKTPSNQAATAARDAIAKVLEKAPNLASAYVLLGLVARDMGQEADAIRHLEKALSLDTADEFAVRELRNLRGRQRKPEGSLFKRLFRR
jgi:CheY-like chemotaxis protein/tetratricopeptide (TPR) repeat protein